MPTPMAGNGPGLTPQGLPEGWSDTWSAGGFGDKTGGGGCGCVAIFIVGCVVFFLIAIGTGLYQIARERFFPKHFATSWAGNWRGLSPDSNGTPTLSFTVSLTEQNGKFSGSDFTPDLNCRARLTQISKSETELVMNETVISHPSQNCLAARLTLTRTDEDAITVHWTSLNASSTQPVAGDFPLSRT
jgi:hypothetical protein